MSISIQKRGKRFTASIRLNGHYVSATFDIKDQAKVWAQRVRRDILSAHAQGRDFDPETVKIKRRRLQPDDMLAPTETTEPTIEEIEERQKAIDADPIPRPDWTLRQALKHYNDTVTDTLDGARQARSRIIAWQNRPLAKKRLADVTPEDIAVWIEGRRKTKKVRGEDGNIQIELLPVAASTVRNDVYRISALYEHARMPTTKKTNGVPAWGLTGLVNPILDVTLPELPAGRQRRLDHGDGDHEGEETKIFVELAAGQDGVQMEAFAILAIETAMRRSEILDLRADEVRSTRLGRVIEREKSKNGDARRIVLSGRATEAVDKLRDGKKGRNHLFSLDGDAVATRWDRARERAGCSDVRMHDIRHEAMSRMADAGLSVGALAAQGGYRTMQTLLRYVNASERDIREKLRQASHAQTVPTVEPTMEDAGDRIDREFASLISQKA